MSELPYRTLPEYNYIGKPGLCPSQGLKKVNGTARYTRDYSFTGMLYAKCLTRPFAHAKIKSMDTSKAEALPGVWDILRYDDPEDRMAEPGSTGVMIFGGDYGTRFIEDTIHYSDQPFGAIVCAENEEICDEALKLIDIEWEELPFLVDPAAALAENATILYPELNPESNLESEEVSNLGDVETGFAEADHIIEFTSNHNQLTVAGVEGQSAVVKVEGEDVYVWSQAQFPNQTEFLFSTEPIGQKNPSHKYHVYTPYSGGHFGGWGFTAYCGRYPQLAVMLAKRTGRPVMAIDDRSHFNVKGMPFGTLKFKVGFKNDGTITAVDIVTNHIVSFFFEHMQHHWGIPNQHVVCRKPYLNLPISATVRDDPSQCFPQQLITTHVAGALGMDPIEVALKNDGSGGHRGEAFAEEKHEFGLPDFDSLEECVKAGKDLMDWDSKWHAPGTKKLPDGKMHGIGFNYAAEWGSAYRFYGKICVRVNQDGKVLLTYRRLDPGMMTENAYIRAVADEIGMKYEDINVDTTTDDGNFDVWGPGGSSGTGTNLRAFIDGARKAKQKILELAVKAPAYVPYIPFEGKTVEELDIKESMVFEKVNPDNKKSVREVVQIWGSIPSYWNFIMHNEDDIVCIGESSFEFPPYSSHLGRQAQFAEVEVDPNTGEVEIKKAASVNDVGKAINPDGCNGQQYGGLYMGCGWARNEQVVKDPVTGLHLNDNLIDYKWFTMNDIGPIGYHLVEGGLGLGPYGCAGIGECVAASSYGALQNAIYNAIGVHVDDFPATPDKILKALGKI